MIVILFKVSENQRSVALQVESNVHIFLKISFDVSPSSHLRFDFKLAFFYNSQRYTIQPIPYIIRTMKRQPVVIED